MNNRDLVGLALKNLLRRKTRTLLAIIGVVVGICAIVVMLSIGFGLSEGSQEMIERYGNLHLVTVRSGGGGMYYGRGGGGYMVMNGSMDGENTAVLDDKAIAFMEKIPGVAAVSPKVSDYLTFAAGKYVTQMEVIGIRPEMLEMLNYELQDGRLLQPGDKSEAVFGNQVPSSFYNPKKTWGSSWSGEPVVDVMTDKMILSADYGYGTKHPETDANNNPLPHKEYRIRGVGILANPEDQNAWSVFMPFEMVKKVKEDAAKVRKEAPNRNSGYEEAMVYVSNIQDVREVSDTIREMGFQPSSMNDWLEAMQDQARLTQGILGGIGAISLFVAALGITNTMIMSIYERTREIGVMKVIGANLPDIKKLFLIEAAMIGFIGGVIGVGVSYLLSLLMNTVLWPFLSMILGSMEGSKVSIIPLWLPLAALGFSTVIGVLSGYSPARRAMNLSALESLRNE